MTMPYRAPCHPDSVPALAVKTDKWQVKVIAVGLAVG